MLNQLRNFASLIRMVRQDGWENVLTGLGTSRDKTQAGQFCPSLKITDAELSWLYAYHDITKRIVNTRPKETYREGFDIEVSDDSEVQKAIREEIKDRELIKVFREARTWGNLYGGCLLIGGIDDGKDMSEPLTDDAPIRSVRYLLTLDRRYVFPATYYTDPMNPKYLEVETYQIITPTGQALSAVHESRCIRFGGALTDPIMRRQNNGWDLSVLQHVYDTVRDNDANWKATNVLLSDASQAVFKIKGLINMLTTPEGVATMTTRMQLLEMCRSVARAVVLDADGGEDFHREPTTFTGIPDLLDRNMMRTSSAAEIPVTMLFGRSAAGMNATGDADFRWFYDGVKSEQTFTEEPALRRCVDWLLRAQDGPTGGIVPEKWDICWPSLWQPTPTEQANIEKVYAERDQIMIEQGVWMPEEVALARSKGDYNSPVEIDEELREKMLKSEKDLANAPVAKNPIPVPGDTAIGNTEAAPVTNGGNENVAPGARATSTDPAKGT